MTEDQALQDMDALGALSGQITGEMASTRRELNSPALRQRLEALEESFRNSLDELLALAKTEAVLVVREELLMRLDALGGW